MEPIVIDAEDVQKYTRKDPLNLECRTEALPIDIVINNFSVPDIGLMKKNGYKKDEYGKLPGVIQVIDSFENLV